MLAHHAFMGLDPFSYTESHRRWVTDEWGSEIALAALFRAFGNAAYSIYAIVLGGLCLVTTRGLRPGPGGAGRPGRRHRAPTRHRHRRHRGGRPRARLLPGVAPARAPAPDQGAGQPALAAAPSAALPGLGQHARLHPPGALRARRRVGLVAHPGALRAADRRRQPVVPHRLAGLALLGSVLASCITPYGPGLLAYDVGVSRNGQIAQYISEWNSPELPLRHDAARLLHSPGRPGGRASGRGGSPCWRSRSGAFLFVEAIQTQRLAVYLLVVAAGAGGHPAGARARGGRRPGAGRAAGLVVLAIVILALPAVPAGQVASAQPVEAFNYLRRTRAGSSRSTRGVTTRWPATGPPSSTVAPTSSRARSSPSSWR